MKTPKIRIHVGAHKTATTYIQDTLALNQAASAAAGTAFWTREQFRAKFSAAISAEKHRRESKKFHLFTHLRFPRNEHIERLSGFFDLDCDVTISEENLLGEAHDGFRGHTYPHAKLYLELLRDALPDRPVEILLCVRSYSSFFSSLYGESLKHGDFIKPARYQEMHSTAQNLWPELVRTLHKTWSDATVIVWCYEDFAKVEDDVLSRMSGLDKRMITKPSQKDIFPSASAEAILAFVKEAPSLSLRQRQIRMLALTARYPRSQTNKFSLFNDSQKERLSDEYQADIETIKGCGYAHLLD